MREDQPPAGTRAAARTTDQDHALSWNPVARRQALGAQRVPMTIWTLLLLFVGGLVLTVVLLAIASWAGEFLGDSAHVAEGPSEEDRTWPGRTRQGR